MFTSRSREILCSWPGTNMATVTSRANQQYLPLNLSNSRSSLKTLFRLRSRCSNGRGKGQIERVRARMAREGIGKWLRDSLPPPPPPHPMHTPKFSLSPSLFYWACQTGPVVRSTFWHICFLVFKFYFNSISGVVFTLSAQFILYIILYSLLAVQRDNWLLINWYW